MKNKIYVWDAFKCLTPFNVINKNNLGIQTGLREEQKNVCSKILQNSTAISVKFNGNFSEIVSFKQQSGRIVNIHTFNMHVTASYGADIDIFLLKISIKLQKQVICEAFIWIYVQYVSIEMFGNIETVRAT